MVLAIETSTPQASLCLYETGEILWRSEFSSDRSHNSHIFSRLAEALDFCDREIDLIAVGVGPGSYSGVRVGIAAANGISIALDVPVVGISSLEAYSEEGSYLVVGDARRKSFFVAEIESGNLSGEPQLLGEAAFEAVLQKVGGERVYSMDQALTEKYDAIVAGSPDAGHIARKAEAARGDLPDHPVPIEPHYLRPPYITKAKKKPVPGFPG